MNFRFFHEDPDILHVGCEPNRSYYVPFASEEEIAEGDSSHLLMLSGDWYFKYFESFADTFKNAFLADDEESGLQIDENNMSVVEVPAVWQSYGVDKHQYTNIRYPFPYDPPFVPEDNPCGLYIKHFDISDEEIRFKSYLNFEGVDSASISG